MGGFALVLAPALGPGAELLLTSVVLTAGCWYWWQRQLKHILRLKRFGVVVPGRLYRSGQLSRFRIEGVLRRRRITTILDLTGEDDGDPHDQGEEGRCIGAMGLAGHRFPMAGDGTAKVPGTVLRAVVTLEQALQSGETVLVHCAAGAQRTGHILTAWLLLVHKANPEEVFHFMRRYHWDPLRNTAWPKQLNEGMAELADGLVAAGIISAAPEVLPQLPSTARSVAKRKQHWMLHTIEGVPSEPAA